jgi:tRNA(adenine34) deaminase
MERKPETNSNNPYVELNLPDNTHEDEYYMGLALEEAQKAQDKGEIPIGAVIVYEDQVVAGAHNLKETLSDPTAHAEILAIQQAAKALKRWRLTGCRLYVTIEPCPMCAGALIQARLDKVVYGAKDPKAGAAESLYNLLTDPRLNHQIEIKSGVLEKACSKILQDFFRSLR